MPKFTVKIPLDYEYGEVVYFKTDPEQTPHQIIGVLLENNNIYYVCSNRGNKVYAFASELTSVPAYHHSNE